jgi:hypothetical protein
VSGRLNLPRRRIVGLLILAATGLLFPTVAVAQDDVDEPDPAQQRQEVLERQTELAGEIDLLRASNDDLLVTLTTFDGQLTDQAARVDEAHRRLVAAGEEVAAARAREDVIVADLGRLEQHLAELAVSSYVGPPTDMATVVLLGGPLDELPKRRVLAGVRLEQVTDAIAALEAARAELLALRTRLEAAETDARRAEADQRARLDELALAKGRQQAVFDQVVERLDHALVESDELTFLDASLGEEVRQREEESARLAESLRQSAAEEAQWEASTAVAMAGPTGAAPVLTPEDGSADAEAEADPEPWSSPDDGEEPVAETPAPTPAPSRSYDIAYVDTTWVWGIEVASDIAPQLEALLEAAYADGLELTGSGYRNIVDQIEIRRIVCGPTDYDIWERPSWECSPPVARPGRSMHEKGLAVDFTGPGGDLVRSQASPTFQWLAVNAARFGFYNLPSEPWHWSTTGG